MERGKICPECGTNGTEKWYYDQILKEKLEIGQTIRRMSAQHGVDKAVWEMDRISLTESMKWMQRKVNKQAKVITRLEEKLKKLNTQPYAEE